MDYGYELWDKIMKKTQPHRDRLTCVHVGSYAYRIMKEELMPVLPKSKVKYPDNTFMGIPIKEDIMMPKNHIVFVGLDENKQFKTLGIIKLGEPA